MSNLRKEIEKMFKETHTTLKKGSVVPWDVMCVLDILKFHDMVESLIKSQAHSWVGEEGDVWDVENLASRLHQVYQEELKRQGKKSKHSDFYSELSEGIKDLDRALARYINDFLLPTQKTKIHSRIEEEI